MTEKNAYIIYKADTFYMLRFTNLFFYVSEIIFIIIIWFSVDSY